MARFPRDFSRYAECFQSDSALQPIPLDGMMWIFARTRPLFLTSCTLLCRHYYSKSAKTLSHGLTC